MEEFCGEVLRWQRVHRSGTKFWRVNGTRHWGALYGGGAAELRRQRARYAAALEQFELYFGPGRQVRLYSAPGRTELGGNHTDHQHGYGLAAAVTLDLIAVASPAMTGSSGSNPGVQQAGRH